MFQSENNKEVAVEYFYLGMDQFFQGNLNPAKENFLTCISLDPNLIYPYCYLSSIYCEEGEVDMGIEICKKALQRGSENTYIHFCLGIAYNHKNLFQEAIQEFLYYLSKFPKDAECLFMIARAYEGLDNIEEAEKYYRNAISADALHYRSYFNLGLIKEKAGDGESAIYLFKQCVSIRYDFWKAWVRLGVNFFNKQDIASACIAYGEALKAAPVFVDLYYNYAICLRLTGDAKQAIVWFKKVLEQAPEDANAWYNLGISYLEIKEYTESQRCMQKTLSYNLELPEAHYRLGYLYLLVGQNEKAKKEYLFLKEKNSPYANSLKEFCQLFSLNVDSEEQII